MSELIRQLAQSPQPFELNVVRRSRSAHPAKVLLLQHYSQCLPSLSQEVHYLSSRHQLPFLEY